MSSTLVCKVELNKSTGVIITVDNADDGLTHTITVGADAITTESKGDSSYSRIEQQPEFVKMSVNDQSTYKQTEDCIEMNCSEFKLTADTMTCDSSESMSLDSSGSCSINAQEDVSITSTSNVKLQ